MSQVFSLARPAHPIDRLSLLPAFAGRRLHLTFAHLLELDAMVPFCTCRRLPGAPHWGVNQHRGPRADPVSPVPVQVCWAERPTKWLQAFAAHSFSSCQVGTYWPSKSR